MNVENIDQVKKAKVDIEIAKGTTDPGIEHYNSLAFTNDRI